MGSLFVKIGRSFMIILHLPYESNMNYFINSLPFSQQLKHKNVYRLQTNHSIMLNSTINTNPTNLIEQTAMFFISKGHIKTNIPPSKLSGQLQLRDSDNFAIIIGKFNQGRCQQAYIYRNDESILVGVTVQIDQKGCVWVGGQKVKQVKYGNMIYLGGRTGYVRNGYGAHSFDKFRMEFGYWSLGKQKNDFVELYKEPEKQRYEYSLIKYKNGACVEETHIISKFGSTPQMKRKVDGNFIDSTDLTLDQFNTWRIRLLDIKQNLRKSKTDFVQPLSVFNTKRQLKYSHSQLKEQNRLTLDVCDAYLQFLAHTQQYHILGTTAILSIYIADFFNLIRQQEEKDVVNVKNQVDHLMMQYKGSFTFFQGFWKHIIIPLVLPKKFHHFSFVRITLLPQGLKCVYYDSLPKKIKSQQIHSLYLKLIKQILMHEHLKDNTNQAMKKAIYEMKMEVYDGFPRQANGDKKSCGYFMLQGVTDLMKQDRITFEEANLGGIKECILLKLREMSVQ